MLGLTTDQKINLFGLVLLPILGIVWAAISKAHRAEISSAEARGEQNAQAKYNKAAGIRMHNTVMDLVRTVGALRDAMNRHGLLDQTAIERTRSRPPMPPDEDDETPA